jgi:uncharacterized protein (TIGR03118 family)
MKSLILSRGPIRTALLSAGCAIRAKNDVVPGSGFGVVDVYSVNGKLLHHLVSNGPSSPLKEPWGMAIAPAGFGPFAGDLLVGNLGNGWINAFDPATGKFLGVLDNSSGAALVRRTRAAPHGDPCVSR